MGYKFSLILSREITEEESAALRKAGCDEAVFTTDSLPTNAQVTVARLDFDDTMSPSLAEAIEAGLASVKAVPDLSVPGLTVPAQPAQAAAEEAAAGDGTETPAEELEAAANPALAADAGWPAGRAACPPGWRRQAGRAAREDSPAVAGRQARRGFFRSTARNPPPD
jgi:hypothetical protein